MAYSIGSGLISQVWNAVRQLNPSRPVAEASQPFVFAMVGQSDDDIRSMHDFLLGPNASTMTLSQANAVLRTYIGPLDDTQIEDLRKADFVLTSGDVQADIYSIGESLFHFDSLNSPYTIKSILGSKSGAQLKLSLAKNLPGFRVDVARTVVRDVSLENAVFVITTALGDVLPSPLLPLLGIAEAASDTAVLTANQVRMLFVLGSIYGMEVGYAAQWKEISSIVGAAFGWRAIARELVSKIPFGGGIVPKGAIAYAGTAAVGEGLIFYFTTGRHMTKAEVTQVFKDTYARGAETVKALVHKTKPELPSDEDTHTPDL